jgi:hypothetical protein
MDSINEPEIRALSLNQPWATLVILGAKKFETRSWRAKRDAALPIEVYIHASQRLPVDFLELFKKRSFCKLKNFFVDGKPGWGDDEDASAWKLIPRSYPVGESGDWDGHFEVTNGLVSLTTSQDADDVEEELQQLVKQLNGFRRAEAQLGAALKKIQDPIAFFQAEAEREGGKLNGLAAVALSENPSWLKDEARKALQAYEQWRDTAEHSTAKI